LNLDGLDVSASDVDQALKVDPQEWKAEAEKAHEHFDRFGDRLPDQLRAELVALQERLT
jgi:phosphoenolpyruvate carboxykinase (GTP)